MGNLVEIIRESCYTKRCMAAIRPLYTDFCDIRGLQGGTMYKILIVEDDLPMAQAIQKEMKDVGK